MRISHVTMLACAFSALLAVVTLAADPPKATVAQNLKTVGLALASYAAEFDDHLPPNMGTILMYVNNNVQVFAPTAVIPDAIVNAPAENRRVWVNENTIFQFMVPLSMRPSQIANPAKTPLVIEKPGSDAAKAKLSVLYADFHVEELPRAEVEAMKPMELPK